MNLSAWIVTGLRGAVGALLAAPLEGPSKRGPYAMANPKGYEIATLRSQ